jgi:hypothetical protein
MQNRKVSFSGFYYLDTIKYCKDTPKIGVFERWGDDVTYEDEKYFQRTIGIVLGDDSQVYKVPPDLIKALS